MKKSLLFIAFLFALYLAGCADKPKSIGNNLLPPDDMFNFAETTFTAISDTVYKVPLLNGYSTSNLAGKLLTGEEFITLLDFYYTSIVDSLQGAHIDTAEIRMTVNYRMLPASPPIIFNIYEVLRSFSEGTFTSDSLNSSLIGATAIGTCSDSMNYGQMVTARITDTSVIRRWADDYLDTSKPDFYGFAIRAVNTTGVIGFTPFNFYSTVVPTLVIKYTRNGYHDSLFFTYGQDTFAEMFTTPPVYSELEVRGGVGVRAKLKFNVSSLSSRQIVNNAKLSLTVDTTASTYSGYSPDTLVALLAIPGSNIDSSSASYYAYGLKKTSTSSFPSYEFSVTQMAQRWINNLSSNEGLAIRWLAENYTSEKVVFFSLSDPDETRRPKLKIIYAEKKQ
jgi:hypothetical protein